jgi:DNA-binding CsgD family transcriptional regulator
LTGDLALDIVSIIGSGPARLWDGQSTTGARQAKGQAMDDEDLGDLPRDAANRSRSSSIPAIYYELDDSWRAFFLFMTRNLAREPERSSGPCVRDFSLVEESTFFLVELPREIWERWGRLSPRQRQVVELIASGSSTSDAARRLGIKPATVTTHLHRVYGRLRVAGRLELARLVAILSLPSPPPFPPPSRAGATRREAARPRGGP